MKKYEVVKDNEYFNQIIKTGIKSQSNYFVFHCLKKANNYEKAHFGIAVGKKIGKAHIRNKYKRITRNIVEKNKFLFPKGYDYIIMIRKSCLEVKFDDLIIDFQNHLEKRGNK